jgi:hypothetical protein
MIADIQHGTLGHRGHKRDPLFEARRVLRRRADRLNEKAITRLQAALAACDPHGEVTAARICAQDLARVPDPGTGRRLALDVIETLLTCPVPEAWRWAAPCAPGRKSSWPTSRLTAPATAQPIISTKYPRAPACSGLTLFCVTRE